MRYEKISPNPSFAKRGTKSSLPWYEAYDLCLDGRRTIVAGEEKIT